MQNVFILNLLLVYSFSTFSQEKLIPVSTGVIDSIAEMVGKKPPLKVSTGIALNTASGNNSLLNFTPNISAEYDAGLFGAGLVDQELNT